MAACQPENVRAGEASLSESVWKLAGSGFSNILSWAQKIFCDIYFYSMNEQNIQESVDGAPTFKLWLGK